MQTEGVQATRPLPGPSEGRSVRGLALALFLLLVGVYGLSAGGHTYSSDEEGMLATTKALADRGSPVIETIPGLTPSRPDRQGRLVGVSGLAQSALAVPLYKAGKAAAAVLPGDDDHVVRTFVGWTNSWVTALGAVFVLLIALQLQASRRAASVIALIYGLATFAWPHSKTFFSEPITTTLALAGAYLTMRAVLEQRQRLVLLGGFVLGLALFGRANAALFLPVAGTYAVARTFGRERDVGGAVRVAAGFGVGAGAAIALLLLTNWWRFGDPFDLGYPQVPFETSLLDGLYGLFVSPGKSLFLYAPITLVGLLAAARAPRGRRPEVALLLAMGAVNALLFARFVHWHGDHSWGPRYLVMTLPFFALPAVVKLDLPGWRRATAAAAAVGFVGALLGSVMYFNQYFDIVADATGPKRTPEGAPAFYARMYYEPYWSPLLGHARAVPAVVRNTFDGLDGSVEGQPTAPPEPLRYGWYFEAPPQLDSWAYWVFPVGAPRALLLLVPAFAGAAVIGAVRLWPTLAARPRADEEADGASPT